tara:strand:+ start:107 stop:1078 length:972 start_codon:yes stop_codon:yes gene_type:complete
MIKDIIQKEINVDITLEPDNYTDFISTFESIFTENNVDEIEEINKLLLEYNVNYFLNKLKKPDLNMQNDLEKLLKEREMESDFISKEDYPSDHLIKKKKTRKKEKEVEEEIEKRPVNINSNQRTNINSSRYNYKINLLRQSIESNELNSITRLIIPIEDNYLFTIPVLKINIPELDCNIYMQQEEIVQGEKRNYGVYKSIETHQLSNEIVDLITIDIQDVSGQKYHGSDILKVNIMEVKKNKIYFTCSSMNYLDYQVSDYIRIINNNTSTLFHILQEPLKIKKIQENIIICEYNGLEYLDNRIYTNIDMKIINMSNQNILFFN